MNLDVDFANQLSRLKKIPFSVVIRGGYSDEDDDDEIGHKYSNGGEKEVGEINRAVGDRVSDWKSVSS